MAAGCVVGTLQALWDTLESSVDMIVDTDKLVDDILGLLEILLSPGGEEACREIGRQSGAQIAADFKRIAGADRIVAAYEIGKIIGPTVTGIVITLLTAGGAAAVVASGRLGQIIAALRRIPGGKLIIDRILKRGKGSKAVKETLDAAKVGPPGETLAVKAAKGTEEFIEQSKKLGGQAKILEPGKVPETVTAAPKSGPTPPEGLRRDYRTEALGMQERLEARHPNKELKQGSSGTIGTKSSSIRFGIPPVKRIALFDEVLARAAREKEFHIEHPYYSGGRKPTIDAGLGKSGDLRNQTADR